MWRYLPKNYYQKKLTDTFLLKKSLKDHPLNSAVT